MDLAEAIHLRSARAERYEKWYDKLRPAWTGLSSFGDSSGYRGRSRKLRVLVAVCDHAVT